MPRACFLVLTSIVACSRAAPAPDVVLVRARLPGAGAAEVERELTEPLEQALGGLREVVSLRSESRPGAALIRVLFPAGRGDPFAAREALAPVLRQLPPQADPPTLSLGPSEAPPLRFVLTSPALDQVALRALAVELFFAPLQMITGVAEVSLCGGAEREIGVELDPDRLAAFGLAPAAALDAVQGASVKSVEELGPLVLATRSGAQVRLMDVARVETRARRPDCVARAAGVPAVVGEVRFQRAADVAKTRAAVAERLQATTLPADAKVAVAAEPRVVAELRLPAGTAPERALQLVERVGGPAIIRWEAARPERVELLADAAPDARDLPGVVVRLLGPPEKEIFLVGSDLEPLTRLAAGALGTLREQPEVAAAGIEEAETAPRLAISFDRARLAELGVGLREAQEAFALQEGGVVAGRLGDAAIRLSVAASRGLEAARVAGKDGALIPLSAVATLRQEAEPACIVHLDRLRAVVLWVRPQKPLSAGAWSRLLKKLPPVPAGVAVVGPL